ncbi:hypothetical protein E2562_013462 [Oryza meyeriana var. granulata]|uniref:Retroviral polymerase SH3-like domain-containing protein n=1 Tax=Oryza meyeriana var. granulata TaxID=110450 RepID=A0A6G1BVW0_9ORYZ|nr:hypothetical protein E2562_013462 [Oryza meyeriana var. granulata]
MIFVGYEGGSKAYRVYDPNSRYVHVTRDVVFDEGASWDWNTRGGGDPNDRDGFTMEYSVEPIGNAASAPAPLVGPGVIASQPSCSVVLAQARTSPFPSGLDSDARARGELW